MSGFHLRDRDIYGLPEEEEEDAVYNSGRYDDEGDFEMSDDYDDGQEHEHEPEHEQEQGLDSKDQNGVASNILKFYPYANNKLTRSVGTFNLSLSNVNLPTINTNVCETNNRDMGSADIKRREENVDECINRWSPFNEENPSTPTLKRTASKSELSPFVNDPEILRKWKYKNQTNNSVDSPSSNLKKTWTSNDDWDSDNKENIQNTLDSKQKSPNKPYNVAKLDQSVFKSNGLVSKMSKIVASYPKKLHIPDTPVKKSPLMYNSQLSNSSIYFQSSTIDESPNMNSADINHTQNTSLFIQSPTFKKTPHIFVEEVSPAVDKDPSNIHNMNINKEKILNYKLASQSSANRYKKIKKSRNSVIFQNNELTNSIQQFTDELYGSDSNYSPSPTQYGKQNSNSYTNNNHTTPTRPKSTPESRRSGQLYSEESGNPSPVRTRRFINAKLSSNPDAHLFDRFTNVNVIGNGQFSKVYQVTFEQTDKKYAVKSLQPNKYNSFKRILQEIKILSEISEKPVDEDGKEYIIDFISSWKYQSCFYVMTNYCENGNLDKFLQEQVIAKNTRLDDWRIWKIIVELCLALRFIHDSCNIVHLDLKPANVMITFEGNLKLGDFGMATHLPLEDTSFENEGDREYIAPEIISDSIYDYRADIFSLGLLIVEIAANVVLPDNGYAWHKLRSGDLSDAGRLSSSDIHSESLFSNTSKVDTNLTDYSNSSSKRPKIPPWVPRFLTDGESLDRMVKWMIEPKYKKRPTAAQILHTEECIYVEMTRKAGAVIQEDDYGPKPNFLTFN
ncbi:hypothetical protein Kpol_2001p46 [Vanderwaltozyma polyspora DSM 70294]|uniref:Protein kinase domain-containing protein n=1 Tax=Vanderwaltozyma polyspora (strain ATCC 22028 / DSM 70294 / BCRC 21397 / CBS 2163 / NBRC 10782 / NRRL Y-8283 / UCD 57-17) TaxID=436907 RepID=A7TGS8_VANPO|nr:uncharacterized protein Kpol_2001p46 [Vanderwaltozyma polyspora DSM 70294]EDO18541.1 hypothetical protein Kpol_2001p46 [Vanderwaltozyma polyspora DSM 70294]